MKAKRNTAQVSVLNFSAFILRYLMANKVSGPFETKAVIRCMQQQMHYDCCAMAGQMAEHSFVLDLFVFFCIKAKRK